MYEYLDDELTVDVVAKVKNHLSICEHCFGKFEFEQHLDEYLSLNGQVTVDSAPLRAKVLERINELDVEEEGGAETEGFFSRFRPYFAVAAAAALIVIGFVFVLDGSRSAAYAKVKPLVENHKSCLLERQNGTLSHMDERDIRDCVAGFLDDPDLLFQVVSDRHPVFGQVVSCPQCRAAHVAFEYADSEISVYIFEDKNYTPPDNYEIVKSDKHDFHCGSFDGMNVMYWRCKGCWCAAVSTIDLAKMISFASVY
jgi:hypothetical protein